MTNIQVLVLSLVTGTVGLITGIFIGGWSFTDSGATMDRAAEVRRTEDVSRHGTMAGAVIAQTSPAAKDSFPGPATTWVLPPDNAANYRLAPESEQESPDESELLEPLRTLLSDLQAYAPEAADELPDMEGNDLLRVEDELRRLMHTSPIYLDYVIDRVRGMGPGPQRDLLLSLIVQSNSPETEDFARELMTSGEQVQIVMGLEIIRDSRRTSPEIRADLLKLLRNSSEIPVIKTAIEALRPAVIEPTEQLEILDTLAAYRVHADSTVRAIAIEKSVDLSARSFAAEMLIQGLTDASSAVRAAAAFSASTSGIQSDFLRNRLFQVLEDSSEDWSVRHHAFNALSAYRNLLVEEYESLKRFEAELIAVRENQSG